MCRPRRLRPRDPAPDGRAGGGQPPRTYRNNYPARGPLIISLMYPYLSLFILMYINISLDKAKQLHTYLPY